MRRSVIIYLSVLIFSGILAAAKGLIPRESYKTLSSNETISIPVGGSTWSATLITEEIAVSFNCLGQIGQNRPPYIFDMESSEYSFRTPPDTKNEYLYGGGIWIGGIVGDDTLVTTGINSWNQTTEFWPSGNPPNPSVKKIDFESITAYRAEFLDTLSDIAYLHSFYDELQSHRPLNIKVANRAYVWDSQPYIVIFDMVITNIGTDSINDGYVGLFFDPDIGNTDFLNPANDDLVGSLRDYGIGMMYDNDGFPVGMPVPYLELPQRRAFATKFLETSFSPLDTNFNWWTINTGWEYDWGPRLIGTVDDPYREFGNDIDGYFCGTPKGDSNKYYMMRHDEWDYDQVYTSAGYDGFRISPTYIRSNIADGYDTRFLLSTGPFQLLPDSSIRVLYATFTSDYVHVNPNNFADNFLYADPTAYLENLDFNDLIHNGELAEFLGGLLRDSTKPVIGLKGVSECWDSVVIEWDPFVFSEVDGYQIYISEADISEWPYEGVCPPWVEPEMMIAYKEIGRRYQYVMDELEPGRGYMLNVATGNQSGVGNLGKSIFIKSFNSAEFVPYVENTFVFDTAGGARLEWSLETKHDIDFYRIYKFYDEVSAANKYHSFYDKGENLGNVNPLDSFPLDSSVYYYYAMEPFAVVDSGMNYFVDSDAEDGNIYFITAVNKLGFESEFSSKIVFNEIMAKSKDVVILIPQIYSKVDYIYLDSVVDFYDSLFSIYPAHYNYDFYYFIDTIGECMESDNYECINWVELTQYRLMIVDDGLYEGARLFEYEEETLGLTKFLECGGIICYFGTLAEVENRILSIPPAYYPVTGEFKKKYFGVDSVFLTGGFYNYPDMINDSLFGFIEAESSGDSLPALLHDVNRCIMDTSVAANNPWPTNSGPRVATFKLNENGEPTHLYRSLYSETSLQDGETVGVQNSMDPPSYLFGFHLWHMRYDDARALIDSILDSRSVLAFEEEEDDRFIPIGYELNQNYPNPFNMKTLISFTIPRAGAVDITLFDILGRRIRTLVADKYPAGNHHVVWDGTDNNGNVIASGIYFYRFEAGEYNQTKKMVLLK